ncbi:MAG TPA: hypothetical protein VLZ56_07410 [Mycoplana sp.]|nr:hypothetical protein [Mycoplana sp.]
MRAQVLFALAAITASLAGCQTITPEEQRAADERQCLDYGFRRGTTAFANCLQRIDLDRSANARARRVETAVEYGWYRPWYGPGPGWW